MMMWIARGKREYGGWYRMNRRAFLKSLVLGFGAAVTAVVLPKELLDMQLRSVPIVDKAGWDSSFAKPEWDSILNGLKLRPQYTSLQTEIHQYHWIKYPGPKYFYVLEDSDRASDHNSGLDPDSPLLTVEEALSRCSSGRSDVVFIMPVV
jgi:hypothetical protein